ncbi:MAG: 16S rRNA (uracil(1498)-N(3))-methyltransferase [Vicinamibacterales bacterium]
MNLLLLPERPAEGVLTLGGPQASHLLRVLKVTQGSTVRIGVENGPAGTGTVTAVAAGSVTLTCTFEPAAPPRPRIDLLLAVPRPKILKRLWAQLAALGVGRIILTNAARVERPYFDTHVLDPAAYRPLLVEGLQQARDTHLPRVTVHRQFRKLVEDELDLLSDARVRLLADPGTHPDLPGVVRPATGRVLLAVGPEGGWNDFERALLRDRGFTPVSMGPRTLRTDTACVALLALLHHALGPGD